VTHDDLGGRGAPPVNRRVFLAAGGAAFMATRFPWRGQRALAVPTPQQLAWQALETGLFVHFGINTFTDHEWGDGTENPALFDPGALDARQWARSARAGGFRYMVLTAKHHDGFCLWPSAHTAHSVRSSPWRGGNGDLVREFVDAARAERLGVGLYLSPWDRNAPSYGSGEGYNDFYIAQLTELLTGYGPLVEVWFDGANGEGPNGKRQTYDWERIHRTVRALQPEALMFSDSGPDIRWIGNERGIAGDPNWCPVNPARVPYPGVSGIDVEDALQHGDPDGTVWRPGEADVSIRPGWFYHPAQDNQVKTADELYELYFRSVGRNANLLVNVPPDRQGLFAEPDRRSLTRFGDRLRALSAAYQAPSAPLDASGSTFEISLPDPAPVTVASLEEALAQGQTIARYRLEAMVRGSWRTISEGTTIGHRKLDRFEAVTTPRMRLVVESALARPQLRRIRLYAQEA